MTPADLPPSPVSSDVPTLCARRGTQLLSYSELEAHLAAIVRLENIGALLGAGASIALGGMKMDDVWAHFKATYGTSLSWLEENSFIHNSPGPNIETLLDDLEVTRLEWTRTGRSRKLQQLERARSDVFRTLIRASLLERTWWTSEVDPGTNVNELKPHRQLLQKLTASRQPGQPSPWIFTTNYDLAIEWAAEAMRLKVTNGFDGLHRRVFAPHNFDLGYRNMLARGEARFGTYNIYLAKLHGSLTWRTVGAENVEEFSSRSVWPDVSLFLDGDSDELAGHLVYPSAAKYLQTIGFVLGELLRRFTEFLSRPQSALIVSGYSFSDEHLNRILTSALQNPTFQLVVYVPEAQCKDGTIDFDGCSPWLKRIGELASPQVTFVAGGSAAYFDAMVSHLPDPAIYDEQAMQIRETLRRYRKPAVSSGNDTEGANA